MASGYIHTYEKPERERLWRQAQYLSPWIFDPLDLSGARLVLDYGCGSGAQISMFADRYPDLNLIGVDRDHSQLDEARHRLSHHIAAGRVELFHSDDLANVADRPIDIVNLCWVLEHNPDPLAVLKTIHDLLPQTKIICTEVFNPSMHMDPKHPDFDTYWQAFNRLQEELGGSVKVGAHLPHLLRTAGYPQINFRPFAPIIGPGENGDSRDIAINYWRDLLLSAKEELLARGYVTPSVCQNMVKCFEDLRQNPSGLFLYVAFQAIAYP